MTVDQLQLIDIEPPPVTTVTDGPEPDPRDYDIVVANLSGKDGHAALAKAVEVTRATGTFGRLFTAHADLGLMEWPGVTFEGRYYPSNAEHVDATAAFYGVPPERRITTRRVVTETTGLRRPQTLLEQIAQMQKFPDKARKFCSVICTNFRWLIMVLLVVIKEREVDLHRQLMEGRASVPRVGSVIRVARVHPPFVVLDSGGVEVADVTEYLRDLVLGDCSPLTCRSYAYGLLRWFRLLWLLGVRWEQATESEVAVLVGWLRTAANPQRRRHRPGSTEPGAVNLRTGKAILRAGYAATTINHALSSVSGFYEYHGHHGRGPVVNPVPSSPQRRRALAHLSPLEPKPVVGRARLRQRVADRPPRSIPDRLWDELFDAMGCERDRALLEFFVSSGARAAELLGVRPEDVDWAGRRIYVVSKGTREREAVPASPQAFVRLALYFDEIGTPASGEPIWRTRRGEDRPLGYSAMRRVLQRANARLGTNWTLHDMRHTAASRMANSGKLTLPEVQAILRHANIQTTGRYLAVGVEELFDKLTEHYARPRPERQYPSGYAAADIQAVFGG
ncbi:site-specific integrase [Saccharothrix sp.]|uniref:tyrosine-type recombinase/integrase n=1 Tax=Saccharothrix sp. TaxID=1873460 RepID=UPI00281162B0|nr:site-specific integrase [Saccharothrix sp.]